MQNAGRPSKTSKGGGRVSSLYFRGQESGRGEGKFVSISEAARACVVSLPSCLTLCAPVDCSLPGSSLHGILRARMMEWAAMPPSGDLPDRGTEPVASCNSCIAGWFFTSEALGKSSFEASSRNCGSFPQGFSLVIKQLTSPTWAGAGGPSIYRAAQNVLYSPRGGTKVLDCA